MKRTLLSILVLVVLILIPYQQAKNFDFVAFDDHEYVYENSHVLQGLTIANIRWAFTTLSNANWHPLTWLSYMLDVSLFGLNPGGYHFSSLLLHLACAVLLFLLIWRWTRSWSAAFLLAAIWAVHPQRAESVVWISERKDVLSLFFGLAALWAYTRGAERQGAQVESDGREKTSKADFARNPTGRATPSSLRSQRLDFGGVGPGEPSGLVAGSLVTPWRDRPTNNKRYFHRKGSNAMSSRSFWVWQTSVFLFLALGLMAKPMLVTLPFLFLVLDWGIWRRFGWPGQTRFTVMVHHERFSWVRPVLEKIPLLLLSLASSVATYVAQNQGAVVETQLLPFTTRLLNASLAYVAYVGKTFWPLNLAVYYPYTADKTQPWLMGIAAMVLLIGITVLALRFRNRSPLVLTGWLWFLGTLVPVIGIVQVGSQALADRYSYLPSIGLWLMVLGFLPPLTTSWRRLANLLLCAFLVFCVVLAGHQVATWRNTTTLFEHALKVTQNNDLAHYSLGMQLEKKGFTNEAAAHFVTTLNINSNYYEAHLALGNIAGAQGDEEAAAQHYVAVLRLAPKNLDAWMNLGMAAREGGDLEMAEKAYDHALILAPSDPQVHYYCGILWVQRGDLARARRNFEQSVALNPDFADGWNSLGKVAFLAGRPEEALRHHLHALRLNPSNPEYHLNRGLAQERLGEDGEALKAYARAANLKPDYGDAFTCLGNLMMKYGKRDDAIRLYERAVQIDPNHPGYRQNLARAKGNVQTNDRPQK